MLSQWDMGGHMIIALGLGAVIGLERQWRERLSRRERMVSLFTGFYRG